MLDAQIVEGIEAKFNALVGDLDERGKRRWAAAEAMAVGYGGITAVALATGLSDRTIRTGIRELRSENPVSSGRQRHPGGGRKPLEYSQEDLIDAIDRLVEPMERGDPQSPLRWTCKSLRNLQQFRTVFTISQSTKRGFRSALVVIRPSSQLRRYDVGGNDLARNATRNRSGC
jgi:hypothetical protein